MIEIIRRIPAFGAMYFCGNFLRAKRLEWQISTVFYLVLAAVLWYNYLARRIVAIFKIIRNIEIF